MGRVVRSGGLAVALVCVFASMASSQTASLTGYIKDETGAVIPTATVVLTSETTGFNRQVQTDDSGLYALVQLPPDRYTLLIEHPGFQRVLRPNFALDAASTRRVDVILSVGPIADTVQVIGPDGDLVHDTIGLGTLIKPSEVENLPVNGRSIQKLIYLAPGIVPVSASLGAGEFSVNGQRASANYVTVDGVSANVSTETSPINGMTAWGNGTLPGFSSNGSSVNLFSLDAVEEVRIQTSSYAPEYGRTPGAQISIVTKSGTSKFAGSAYEFFRDDALDAADFFVNARGLRKPALRYNTFGGTLGGPLRLGPTFFFGNYEGQRLTVPQFRTTAVPTQELRDSVFGSLRTLLNAFPLPNGRLLAPNVADFSAAFNDSSRADSGALRADVAIGDFRLFGRVSGAKTRAQSGGGPGNAALSDILLTGGQTITATVGTNVIARQRWVLESRLNYSTNSFDSASGFTPLNGAQQVPLDLALPPTSLTSRASVNLTTGITGNNYSIGVGQGSSQQRQVNGVLSATTVVRGHTVKAGTDVRYLAPDLSVPEVRLTYALGSATTLQGSTIARATIQRGVAADGRLWNASLFAQDHWQVNQRLTLTYGVRWDINPAPSSIGDRRPVLVENPEDPTQTRRRDGRNFWRTDYKGLAPRVAAAYRLGGPSGDAHIIRGAVGLFYDIGWGGSTAAFGRGFPFTTTGVLLNVPLPLAASSIPDLASPDSAPGASTVYSFPDEMPLPRSTQWNIGYEYSHGSVLSVAATYLGARGHDLSRTVRYDYGTTPGAPFLTIDAIDTSGRSEYEALEARLRVRPWSALEAEAAYTLGDSKDNVSEDVSTGIPLQRQDLSRNWGPSNFDVRHSLNWRVGATTPSGAWRVLGDISVYLSALYRSALPTTPAYFRDIGFGNYTFRPDLVPGVPLYLEDDAYPGGRRVNPAAFVIPTEARQGTAGRNSIRAFPLSQLDLSIKKRLRIRRARIDVGLDVFNLFNRPQFGDPNIAVGSAIFGLSQQTMAAALGTGTNGRGLNPLFQPGGPRSLQLVLRTTF